MFNTKPEIARARSRFPISEAVCFCIARENILRDYRAFFFFFSRRIRVVLLELFYGLWLSDRVYRRDLPRESSLLRISSPFAASNRYATKSPGKSRKFLVEAVLVSSFDVCEPGENGNRSTRDRSSR